MNEKWSLNEKLLLCYQWCLLLSISTYYVINIYFGKSWPEPAIANFYCYLLTRCPPPHKLHTNTTYTVIFIIFVPVPAITHWNIVACISQLFKTLWQTTDSREVVQYPFGKYLRFVNWLIKLYRNNYTY